MLLKNEKYEKIWDKDCEQYYLKITNLDNGNYCHKYKDGREYWYNKNDKLHCDGDKPAIIRSNGDKHWWKNGLEHRDGDKPAIIQADGRKVWCKNGRLHRDGDKPVIIQADGTKKWYRNGRFIKKEGP